MTHPVQPNPTSKASARANALLQTAAILGITTIAGTGMAYAGADATFNTAFNTFSGYLEGSAGRLITLVSFIGGVIAMGTGRFSWGQVGLPVGVGIAVGTGIPIVTASVTAII